MVGPVREGLAAARTKCGAAREVPETHPEPLRALSTSARTPPLRRRHGYSADQAKWARGRRGRAFAWRQWAAPTVVALLAAMATPISAQVGENTPNFGVLNFVQGRGRAEQIISSTEQVVFGKLLFYGEMEIRYITELIVVMKSVLSKICAEVPIPVIGIIEQLISTYGFARIGFEVDYQLLPHLGGGKACAEAISIMSYGPIEPPFTNVTPAPLIREVIQDELRGYRPTRTLDIEQWTIEFRNTTCDRLPVLRLDNHSKAEPTLPPIIPTTEPECIGKELPSDWEPPGLSAWDATADTCEYINNPCVCASVGKCIWRAKPISGYGCEEGNRADRVPCAFCPSQEKCPVDPIAQCAAHFAPCACAGSVTKCRWDDETVRCVVKEEGEYTPCRSCSRQSFCASPKIESIDPEPYSIMGFRKNGWILNVTFDRDILLGYELAAEVKLACRMPYEKLDVERTMYVVPRQQLTILDNVLFIDTRMPNDKPRDCLIYFDENSVTDTDFIAFEGLPEPPQTGLQTELQKRLERYEITLPDTMQPFLASFVPENSAVEVPLNVTVMFKFTESVVVASNTTGLGKISLHRLGTLEELRLDGGELPNATQLQSAADILVKEFDFEKPTVHVTGSTLSVELKDVGLEHGVYYSLAIPPDYMTDTGANSFAGLPRKIYVFRTAFPKIGRKSSAGKEVRPAWMPVSVPVFITAASGVTILLVALILTAAQACRVRVSRRKNLERIKLEGLESAAIAAENSPSASTASRFRGASPTGSSLASGAFVPGQLDISEWSGASPKSSKSIQFGLGSPNAASSRGQPPAAFFPQEQPSSPQNVWAAPRAQSPQGSSWVVPQQQPQALQEWSAPSSPTKGAIVSLPAGALSPANPMSQTRQQAPGASPGGASRPPRSRANFAAASPKSLKVAPEDVIW